MDATAVVQQAIHSGNLVRPPLETAAVFAPVEPFDSLENGISQIVTMEGVKSQESKMALFSPRNVEPAKLAELHEPYLHFLSPPKPQPELLSPDWKVIPQFCSTPQRFGVEIKLEPGSHCYGGGEQARQLCLNNTQYITWNTDIPYYSKQKKSLYQSHPFIMVLRKDGTAFGVLANSTYPLFVEMTDDHIKVLSHTEYLSAIPFSVLIFEAPNPQGVTKTLSAITGYMALPPKWSIGYQQCRWSYYPDTRALEVAKSFREKKIPCDVIWFDIHYMDDYRIFTFDPKTFPNPKQLNDQLHELGFHTIWMIDPGVKKESGYFVSDQVVENDLGVLLTEPGKETSDQRYYEGPVWPGNCLFPDFTMEDTRKWWSTLYKDFMAQGVDGVWNDMNEPAVFNDTMTASRDAWHRGFGGGCHERFHNVYGFLMIKASREGILAANPDKRPFVLSRANFLGGQRFGATWTGDNVSTWPHLALSIPMILNLGISAQPFCGPDIGGFLENADKDLFARWMGFGALLPFARAHTHEATVDHEPWSFGDDCTKVTRAAINRRYQLLPYFYTLFYISSQDGLPVARPLFYSDPCDQDLRKEDRAFLIGDDVLVIANVHDPHDPTPQEPVAIPKNQVWYDLELDDVKDDNLPIMKIRSGSIVVSQEVEQYSGENTKNRLIIFVALNEEGAAVGQLYVDAGDGFEYQTGEYRLTNFKAELKENQFTVTLEEEGGHRRPDYEVCLNIISKEGKVNHETSLLSTENALSFPVQF